MSQFRKIAVIGNPAAKNGAGAQASRQVARLLSLHIGEASCALLPTQRAGHATDIAASLDGFDAVVAVGGDGLVNEVANGLMRRSASTRPVLGVIPVGSGNDYAASLGMSENVERAVRQVLDGAALPADVGRCNGRYFVETLSFGLDAAIALDTMERRKKTGRTGTLLYLESGVEQILHHLETYRFKALLDGADAAPGDERTVELEGSSHLFAVQIGPTYGGHFRICPDARLDDGMLDVCIAHAPLNVASGGLIFLLAKAGRHTRFKKIELRKTRGLRLTFDRLLPAQIDGELIEGADFAIDLAPGALRVVRGGQ